MYRAQAAMEYLMTYGWALLAIVIVIALLLYLNPFQIQEVCVPDPGIDCTQPLPVLKSTGKVNFTLKNGLPGNIIVTGINCTNIQGVPTHFQSVSVTVPQGGLASIESPTCLNFQTGSPYQGYIYIQYRFANDESTTKRVISARIKLSPQS
ncbi:MAG: hypothetical protein N3E37_03580 [Candidatus Micrarchaeota archaeon]|nr:hypothetical protein [Candidatus Micrarchaeota archaeon]